MEQTMTNVIAPKAWSPGLNKTMVALSVLGLATVFYVNGTMNKFLRSSPPPNESQASGIPATEYRTTSTTSVSDVVTKAAAFYSMLTTSQQAQLQQTYTTTLARKWSNLPCGGSCRNGIEFNALTSAELSAALQVIQAALGTGSVDGYNEFLQIRLSEQALVAGGGSSGYDTSYRWICFLNAPTATGTWMLQFGGHHYAANIAFNNGHVIGATPFFMGLEPKSFTLSGTTYAPLDDEHDALTAMLASLTSSELTSAQLSSTFSDCYMIPGESNGGASAFPAKVGIMCNTLTTTQKDLVLAAITHYVDDMDSVTANALMNVYTNQIDSTYISWTGSGTSGSASTFLNANANYVRIDGPQVWIEMTCQNGVVFPLQIHYHTVWRDHRHDYGLDLTGSPVDTTSTTSITPVNKNTSVTIYPNPTEGALSVSLSTPANRATVYLTNTVGETTAIVMSYTGNLFKYDMTGMPAGLYVIRFVDNNNTFVGKFNKL